MIILLPAVLLLIAGLAIYILHQTTIKVGYSWFLAIGAARASLVTTLAFHWIPTIPFVLDSKILTQNTNLQLILQIDLFSFPYALSLVALGFVIILTDLGRMQENANHTLSWAAMLIIVGTGYLAIISISPLMIIFSWTIIDLFEMVLIVRTLEDKHQIRESVLAFTARVGGTMLVVVASIYSRSLGQALTFSHVLPGVGIFLLMAVGLRLGVIPLNLPYSETGTGRGVGTLIRLVSPASSLVILSRLPAPVILSSWGTWLLFFLCISMLYSSFMWLTAENEIVGRPFWIITISAFAIGCAIHSQPSASIGWGVALILSGGILFLYSSRKIQLLFLPLLGLIGISGLPFTPTASSWQAWLLPHFDIVSFIFLITHIITFIGYLRHTFRTGGSFDGLARWAQVLFPVGLVILSICEWFLGVFGWPGSFTPGLWLPSLLINGLAILIYFGYDRFLERLPIFRNQLIIEFGRKVFSFITSILSFNWLIQLGLFLYGVLQRIIASLTLILEGEGGILWALLLLTLIISLARSGGKF